MGMGIMAILVLCANPIVLILGGSDSADSSIPLMLISPSILFSALNIVLANHMISSQQERFWATVNVVGLAIAVVSNILLIPVWGVDGAAVSISVCEFCMFVMRCVACRGLLLSIRKRIDPVKIIFCAAAALAMGFSLMKAMHPNNAVIELLGGSVTFGSVYLVLLLVAKEKFTYSLYKTATKKFRIGRKLH
jgi:O-antigen/teichoic acid export membrane protein